ncbi:hypothetical protein VOLCADRAFT_98063 [Volvox carteri f. nagariensis]|uniref:Uncharacterized protein n=1 Tax=Volvox carteri f. nagariensis TaxID=3068 RepID=D8UEC4_VOLCA|nr:uncharacterized protein VOLCADRAFT_98063 [Volvox carteri f. nagariensis]EFJ41944.1 hypothetical protein VOLCADRAFT_98063 [Volvox carteri f. nagariensis]|eukprot:XP_002956981.1 hypothetical protein VOLCADRAFT_98063 [Volvox carteri f. nagariensis]
MAYNLCCYNVLQQGNSWLATRNPRGQAGRQFLSPPGMLGNCPLRMRTLYRGALSRRLPVLPPSGGLGRLRFQSTGSFLKADGYACNTPMAEPSLPEDLSGYIHGRRKPTVITTSGLQRQMQPQSGLTEAAPAVGTAPAAASQAPSPPQPSLLPPSLPHVHSQGLLQPLRALMPLPSLPLPGQSQGQAAIMQLPMPPQPPQPPSLEAAQVNNGTGPPCSLPVASSIPLPGPVPHPGGGQAGRGPRSLVMSATCASQSPGEHTDSAQGAVPQSNGGISAGLLPGMPPGPNTFTCPQAPTMMPAAAAAAAVATMAAALQLPRPLLLRRPVPAAPPPPPLPGATAPGLVSSIGGGGGALPSGSRSRDYPQPQPPPQPQRSGGSTTELSVEVSSGTCTGTGGRGAGGSALVAESAGGSCRRYGRTATGVGDLSDGGGCVSAERGDKRKRTATAGPGAVGGAADPSEGARRGLGGVPRGRCALDGRGQQGAQRQLQLQEAGGQEGAQQSDGGSETPSTYPPAGRNTSEGTPRGSRETAPGCRTYDSAHEIGYGSGGDGRTDDRMDVDERVGVSRQRIQGDRRSQRRPPPPPAADDRGVAAAGMYNMGYGYDDDDDGSETPSTTLQLRLLPLLACVRFPGVWRPQSYLAGPCSSEEEETEEVKLQVVVVVAMELMERLLLDLQLLVNVPRTLREKLQLDIPRQSLSCASSTLGTLLPWQQLHSFVVLLRVPPERLPRPGAFPPPPLAPRDPVAPAGGATAGAAPGEAAAAAGGGSGAAVVRPAASKLYTMMDGDGPAPSEQPTVVQQLRHSREREGELGERRGTGTSRPVPAGAGGLLAGQLHHHLPAPPLPQDVPLPPGDPRPTGRGAPPPQPPHAPAAVEDVTSAAVAAAAAAPPQPQPPSHGQQQQQAGSNVGGPYGAFAAVPASHSPGFGAGGSRFRPLAPPPPPSLPVSQFPGTPSPPSAVDPMSWVPWPPLAPPQPPPPPLPSSAPAVAVPAAAGASAAAAAAAALSLQPQQHQSPLSTAPALPTLQLPLPGTSMPPPPPSVTATANAAGTGGGGGGGGFGFVRPPDHVGQVGLMLPPPPGQLLLSPPYRPSGPGFGGTRTGGATAAPGGCGGFGAMPPPLPPLFASRLGMPPLPAPGPPITVQSYAGMPAVQMDPHEAWFAKHVAGAAAAGTAAAAQVGALPPGVAQVATQGQQQQQLQDDEQLSGKGNDTNGNGKENGLEVAAVADAAPAGEAAGGGVGVTTGGPITCTAGAAAEPPELPQQQPQQPPEVAVELCAADVGGEGGQRTPGLGLGAAPSPAPGPAPPPSTVCGPAGAPCPPAPLGPVSRWWRDPNSAFGELGLVDPQALGNSPVLDAEAEVEAEEAEAAGEEGRTAGPPGPLTGSGQPLSAAAAAGGMLGLPLPPLKKRGKMLAAAAANTSGPPLLAAAALAAADPATAAAVAALLASANLGPPPLQQLPPGGGGGTVGGGGGGHLSPFQLPLPLQLPGFPGGQGLALPLPHPAAGAGAGPVGPTAGPHHTAAAAAAAARQHQQAVLLATTRLLQSSAFKPVAPRQQHSNRGSNRLTATHTATESMASGFSGGGTAGGAGSHWAGVVVGAGAGRRAAAAAAAAGSRPEQSENGGSRADGNDSARGANHWTSINGGTAARSGVAGGRPGVASRRVQPGWRLMSRRGSLQVYPDCCKLYDISSRVPSQN